MSVTREKINEILTETGKDGFFFTDCGNEVSSPGMNTNGRLKGYDLQKIEMLTKLVRSMWEPATEKKTIKQNVYGMSQEVQDVRKFFNENTHAYVCVGNLSMAILLCGFNLDLSTWNDRNVRFYFKLTPGYEAFLNMINARKENVNLSTRKYKKIEKKAQKWIEQNKV